MAVPMPINFPLLSDKVPGTPGGALGGGQHCGPSTCFGGHLTTRPDLEPADGAAGKGAPGQGKLLEGLSPDAAATLIHYAGGQLQIANQATPQAGTVALDARMLAARTAADTADLASLPGAQTAAEGEADGLTADGEADPLAGAILIDVSDVEGLPQIDGQAPRLLALLPEGVSQDAFAQLLGDEVPVLFAEAAPVGTNGALVGTDGTPIPAQALKDMMDNAFALVTLSPEAMQALRATPTDGSALPAAPTGEASGPGLGALIAEGLSAAAIEIVPAMAEAGDGEGAKDASGAAGAAALMAARADGQTDTRAIDPQVFVAKAGTPGNPAQTAAQSSVPVTDLKALEAALKADLAAVPTPDDDQVAAQEARLRALVAEAMGGMARHHAEPPVTQKAQGSLPSDQIFLAAPPKAAPPTPLTLVPGSERPSFQPPAPPPVHQLSFQVSRAVLEGATRMTVRLDPPELGQVSVRLDFQTEGAVRAYLSAERPETLDLLQRDARFLERALNDAGVKTDSGSLNFSLGQQGQGGEGAPGQKASGRSFADILENPDAADEESEAEDDILTVSLDDFIGADLSGGVNILI